MKTTVIKVTGMSCRHCQAAVENTVKAFSGVNSVKVNLNQGIATVDYDEQKVTIRQITDSIEEIGYRVG